uniref:ATP synthase subunit b n=1 Tax=Monodon monoceros TaxID=40151 RepID=A0A8C6AYM1_MONMO
MLSRVVLSAATAAAPSLKNAALLGPGVLQATRIFHKGQPSPAPVPPLPEYGGKVCLGLIPEEFFQFLYPKTGCHYLFDVQRNNIAMALEVTYWERLHSAYKEVKNRLDYHISVQDMMRLKEQGHTISWVEKNVVQSISV